MPVLRRKVIKKPGEEMVKVFYQESGGRIHDIVIAGDFFIHPSEAIAKIEGGLFNCPIETHAMSKKLEEIIMLNRITLQGISIDTIVQSILEAE